MPFYVEILPPTSNTRHSKILSNELCLIQVKLRISEKAPYLGALKAPHRDPGLPDQAAIQGPSEGRAKDFHPESNYEVA